MSLPALADVCDLDRRQGGVARLYGQAALERLRAARVMVIGIGGVGSWAAEALARSGVGALDLVDLDHVAESNMNRQIHALESTLGQAKVDAMAARIDAINPECRVRALDRFAEVDALDELLQPAPDLLIDAIDQAAVKVALIAWCARHGIPLVVCGAAGGRRSRPRSASTTWRAPPTTCCWPRSARPAPRTRLPPHAGPALRRDRRVFAGARRQAAGRLRRRRPRRRRA